MGNVDVPVAVPRAVPREIVTHHHVAKPYEVAVPRAVPVPAPYKVHPVQEIVETPHIDHATPVHAVAHAPVAVSHAAPVAVAHAAPVAFSGHALAAAPVGAAYSAAWPAVQTLASTA